MLEVNFGRREEDLREAKRVPARAADTRLITPYGINAHKHIPFKQRIRTV